MTGIVLTVPSVAMIAHGVGYVVLFWLLTPSVLAANQRLRRTIFLLWQKLRICVLRGQTFALYAKYATVDARERTTRRDWLRFVILGKPAAMVSLFRPITLGTADERRKCENIARLFAEIDRVHGKSNAQTLDMRDPLVRSLDLAVQVGQSVAQVLGSLGVFLLVLVVVALLIEA